MNCGSPLPAAQYVRMSTEHQQYSIDNQKAAIQKYCETHGFFISRTYSDGGKSGVVIKNRLGLQKLLQDVVGGNIDYRSILVYDVSRWGRFQDADEAAHYEFLCKSAGVPVHYCAEVFANDDAVPNMIMKALKRTMAGEYSRELSVRVRAGARRIARLGFKQGGAPGYGLGRMLVSSHRQPKQLLQPGEHKSIATDRVVLVLGHESEVQWVRDIFRMFVVERLTPKTIAQKLNQENIPYRANYKWNKSVVRRILSHPKYAGCAVFGRTTQVLHTPRKKLAESDWILTPGAHPAIVDQATFQQAKHLLFLRTRCGTDEQLLDALRELLAQEGKLSYRIMRNARGTPSATTYQRRFGSVGRAYDLIGYRWPLDFRAVTVRSRTMTLRDKVIAEIQTIFGADVSIVRHCCQGKPFLQMKNGPIVSVLVCRFVQIGRSPGYWDVHPTVQEREHMILAACCNSSNDALLQPMYLLAGIKERHHLRNCKGDRLFDRAVQLFSRAISRRGDEDDARWTGFTWRRLRALMHVPIYYTTESFMSEPPES